MSDQHHSFWELLETNSPIGGPRRHLNDLFGADTVRDLERLKILSYHRVSDIYPCPHPGGEGCPRQVIEIDNGTYHAVCGNSPRQCEDLVLTQKDVEHLGVEPRSLCDSLARTLQVRPKFEAIASLAKTYRIGTFIPEPGVRQPVFLAIRCAPRDYAEVLDALRSRHEGDGFAVLLPTDRFLSDDTARQMASIGIPLLPLDDVIGIDDGNLTALVDPLTYFRSIGQRGPGTSTTGSSVVAQALVCSGDGKPTWRDLDEQGYQDLVAAAADYLIFADERTRTGERMMKGKCEKKDQLPASYFQILRACAEHRGYYDPATDLHFDGVFDDPKQTFVRARQYIDLKATPKHGAKADYALFKTHIVDKHAMYEFAPSPGVAFALLFQPST